MDVDVEALPYDDESGAKYAEEHPELDFKNRIGAGRLYLLAESSARSRSTREAPEEVPDEEDAAMDDSVYIPPPQERDNAILFRGEPIANLPTQRIFKYICLSTKSPLGLEWVDDMNVVLVWSTHAEARRAFRSMREAGTLEMEEDDEGFLPARPIPETLAPMEMRLEKALGKAVQEQGQMWMRWARSGDVKQKGKNKSKFYEKYGEEAGKEGQNVYSGRKRKRDEVDERSNLRKQLDAELDGFADGDADAHRRRRSASPSRREHGSRSRRKASDYGYDQDLLARLGPQVVPAGGNVREWDVGKEWETDEFGRSTFGRHEGSSRTNNERGGRTNRLREPGGRQEARPTRTKEELDAELDAFLEG